jgi:uncharacterized repeat protein (TIGR03803 family)
VARFYSAKSRKRRFNMSFRLRNRGFGIAAFAAALLALVISAAALPAQAQTYTVLHSFSSSTDGANPTAGLSQGTSGNLFGTTSTGGTNGSGTTYLITPEGTLTTLYDYCSTSHHGICMDGKIVKAGIVQSAEVFFYGVTVFGGNLTANAGILFKISPTGNLTILHDFVGADGSNPYASLYHGTNGFFYGSTTAGGANGLGTLFNIDDLGTFTSLHSFSGTDGQFPVAQMIEGADGNFYGTTELGGANGANAGTVFELSSTGVFTTLYNFCSLANCADGRGPVSALLQNPDGNFFGTTESGGAHGAGAIYEISSTGTFSVLYSFCSQAGCTDGRSPEAGLFGASDGNFYGITTLGGTPSAACALAQHGGCGTIFQLAPSGVLTTLYNFCQESACTDGNSVRSPLVQDTNGRFYGTTEKGGANNDGLVFSLSTGLRRFVVARPDFGKAGNNIKILGTNLTGATSVTFNGTPATFSVVQGSLISAAVPTGATTGKIEVVTPAGTLLSDGDFQVQ